MNTEDFNEKQEADLDQYAERQRRSFQRGKLLVYLIAGINILFDIILIFITREIHLIEFVIHIALAAALIYGITWVRYLYAAAGVLTILSIIPALPELVRLIHLSAVRGGYVLILMLPICFSAASAMILIFSESVKEYMYTKNSQRY